MMKFNEAYNYANFLNGIIGGLENLIFSTGNYTKTTENHLKSKSYSEAQDEVITAEVDRIFTGQVHNLAFLTEKLINEKLKLATAIEAAKANTVVDWKEDGKHLSIDTAIEYNKQIRQLATHLNKLSNAKPSVIKKIGRSYKINVAGDQVPYNYDVEVTTELDYNKNTVKDLYKKLLNKADKISSLLDDAQGKDVVDYTAPYDVHDTLEDIIAAYEESLTAK
jgi:hypothetical protein